MPNQGINVSATVIDQSNNNSIAQNAAITSSKAVNGITIINLPEQHWCQTTVTVTSVDKPSNSLSKSFTLVYKLNALTKL